jgi:hypothetical protein
MVDDRDAKIAQLEAEVAALRSENGELAGQVQRLQPALTEARVQQSVTADVLRVIATAPTDLASVLDSIIQSASRVCPVSQIFIGRMVGDELELVACLHSDISAVRVGSHFRPHRRNVMGRAVVEGTTIHVHDLAASLDEYPASMVSQRTDGYRPRTRSCRSHCGEMMWWSVP